MEPTPKCDPKGFRSRTESEDTLLNSRTAIFLTTNGLLAAAVGLGRDCPLQIGTAVLAVLVCTMWLACSWQSWRVIKALTMRYRTCCPDDEVEATVQKALFPHWCRPTNILAKWLPMLFGLYWLAYIAWRVTHH